MTTPTLQRLRAWVRHDSLLTQPLFLQGQAVVGDYHGLRLDIVRRGGIKLVQGYAFDVPQALAGQYHERAA